MIFHNSVLRLLKEVLYSHFRALSIGKNNIEFYIEPLKSNVVKYK